jgi:hypothetical protein
MQFVVHHDTGGTNSYWVCKDGRPDYDTGLCQILLPKVGVPWQFSEIDSVAYHCGSSADYDRDGDADNYNRAGPGLEVERRQGEPLTADQTQWLGKIGRWLESEWRIPNVQYRGAPLTDADNFRGHVNHRDLHPNPDGLSAAEWASVTVTEQPPKKKDDDPMLYVFNPHAPSEIWCFAGNSRRHVTPDEWAFVQFVGGKAIKVSKAWFDSYPVAA